MRDKSDRKSPTDLERELVHAVSGLNITDSLLFLNKVLAVWRGEIRDPPIRSLIPEGHNSAPAFVFHLIAKYLIQHGSLRTPFGIEPWNFGGVWEAGLRLAIADPISDSADASCHGYFVRMSFQQMRRHVDMQSYGLAIGLFHDLDAIAGPKPIDLRREVENALGMPVELFMRIGQAALTGACASYRGVALRGTLNLEWLSKAAVQIPDVPWSERWADFARVTVGTPHQLRADCTKFDTPGEYAAYRFNPLRRRPIVAVSRDRFIAIDPSLVAERITWGVFYDVFERYQEQGGIQRFVDAFGYAFERFVDNLLGSTLSQSAIWRENDSELVSRIKRAGQRKTHKVGDLAYRGPTHPVLIECASLRPTRDLFTMATQELLEKAAERMADELQQAFEHIEAIQRGDWVAEGLVPGKWTALLVTFGRFETANFIFFRKSIETKLKESGVESMPPYLVLSLAELDSVIRLVERGKEFGELIAQLGSRPSYDPLREWYGPELSEDAVSTFAKLKTERMYDFLPRQRTE